MKADPMSASADITLSISGFHLSHGIRLLPPSYQIL